MRQTVVLAAIVVSLAAAAAPARAESRAWIAAKKVLPAGLQAIAGGHVAELRKTATFKKLWPRAVAQLKDGAEELAKIEKKCGFVVVDKVDSIVIALDKADNVVAVLALDASAKQLDCVKKGWADKLKWLDKSTVAFATAASDKLTGGGLADDKVIAGALANAKTGAAMWAVVVKPPLPIQTSIAYGHATFASSTVALELHLVVDSVATATAVAMLASSQLDQMRKAKGTPVPEAEPFVKTLAITASGGEVVVTTSAPESAIPPLVDAIEKQ